jgi:formate hydrogenlyase transcriptional activator
VTSEAQRRERHDDDAALRAIVEGVEAEIGDQFFASLVRQLASALDVQCAFVSELTPDRQFFRTLALWARGALRDNVTVRLAGTPCEAVLNGETAHYSANLQAVFPRDPMVVEWGAASYCGVPLVDRSGVVAGHLAIYDDKPMWNRTRCVSIMRIFAARARAEIERMRMERELRASEQWFRDLYDEAPIAYIYEETDSRFVSANRAAMTLLGLRPEEVRGTLGLSLVAPTPEIQERVHRAIETIQKGKECADIELELRRKDDGRPIWVRWWSKPEPDGKYTRTMLVDITDRVLAERERNHLQEQNLYLREEIEKEYNFEEIIGSSGPVRDVLAKIRQVAPTDSTVLIIGETGTGKELVARAIHKCSQRASRAFVSVNCAAIPATLIASELFGHEKGAFTGAVTRRVGRFELADGGTLFLDEVGDLPLDTQLALLRVLQEREFERVGSTRPIKVDVRIIAATNRDLGAALASGTLRADFFYRLSVFPIEVPPLWERATDIPLLVSYFVDRYATKAGKTIRHIDTRTLELIQSYRWPGNVRELQNVIERAVIVCDTDTLVVGDNWLSRDIAATQPPISPLGDALVTRERQMIEAALTESKGKVAGRSGAAAKLGIPPSTLESKIRALKIRKEQYKQP